MAPGSTVPGYSAGADIPSVVVVPTYNLSSSLLMVTGIGRITAITWSNTATTTPSLFYLRDGIDGTGPIIATLAAVAGGGSAAGFWPPGIPFVRGLYVSHVTGSMLMTVCYIPLVNPAG